MEFKDYYATLGVPKTATEREIKQAYRKLARRFHPDVNPGDKKAEARFKEINEAYEVLGDPEKRRKYDELGANWRLYEQAQRTGASPFGTAWEPYAGGTSGGFRTIDEEEMRRIFGTEDPFSDFFRMFFGGARPAGDAAGRTRRSVRQRAGSDVEHQIDLTLDEAFRGTTRRISIKEGSHTRTVDVRIPAGVDDGSRVRVAGEGAPGVGGGPPGDLFLLVRLLPHPVFERRGRDLYTRIRVPVTTAVLGGSADVPTPDGPTVRLRIPAGTSSGQIFRLHGRGMPAVGKPADRGDLYATAEIEIPRQLTPEQRRHYEALAALERR